ncbi:DUF5686 and carboxypeptidase regulatory-like domain-containing protein [Hymenobacter sp. HSC-4F20]|uniref:DUF5686 and carboxypeptidase-like regulatory domain-containing protein n=1 Tax=Hymenobacter sp. HSC-4F20 TaxID=2864135 RepID=UPI001C738B24|nr:DUF5686 and carboxypeptidase-like regulatory domain-containing protein [Hymenobacter sp. HSC-4F20]MBX0291684.1 DUF5686 and carboxypeptidase regulatory-like domain-containing protein [Hymenobacter sp. HSC-4F20]
MKGVFLLLCLLLLLGAPVAWAQRVVFSGQVTEAATGQPVPFASVFVRGTSQGTTADDNGRYQLTASGPVDTLVASAIGFAAQKKKVTAAERQTINFTLGSGSVSLGEVVVRPSENPAYAILRRVQQHKARNDKRHLRAFEFQSYNRTEVSLNNLPDQLSRRKVLRQMAQVADSLGVARDAQGKPVVPIFASEVLSRFYQNNDPLRRREEIQQTQMRGAAPREGSVVSQIMGSSFQDWDFYRNWQQLLGKDFISPIADGWKFTYEYELQDSVMLGQDFCYQIGVVPRRPHDLAFSGTIWITADTYALRRLDLSVSPEANLNFVEQIRVYQEMAPTAAGAELPRRTRVIIGIKPTKGSTGVLARFTTVNSGFVVNQPKPLPFYDRPLETAATAFDGPKDFFDKNRPDSLSRQEQATLMVLDSVRQLPAVRSLLELADVAVNGYYRLGKLDLGPILTAYSFNSIEGHRFRVGFRTTPELSRDWLLRSYLAYGTRDGRFKYGLRVQRVLDRRRWTVANFEHRHDLDQVALLDNDYALENPLFEASARLGDISSSRPLRRDLTTVALQSDLFRGFTQRVMVRHQQFRPLYPFAYYTQEPHPGSPTTDHFDLAEIVLESRYARDEVLVENNQNRRTAIGVKRWPVFTVRYTLGVDDVLGSDFRYHKLNLLIDQSLRLGQLGRTDYRLDAGYIPSTVPYPVLKTHLGNQSPFYNAGAFNLMRYFEFVSDQYVAFRVENQFDGFLLNSLPAIKQLNWRLVATGNLLWGSVRESNRRIIPQEDPINGGPLPSFRPLGRTPYAEVGYGVENIFKVARVDFLHRLTYRQNPGARTFGVKVSFQFKL